MPSPTRRAIFLIMVTQMLGWGTTMHLPTIIGVTLAADLGLPLEVVFGGLAIMMTASALISPRVGLLIDRRGPGAFLCAGSLFAGLGLFLLSGSQGFLQYAAAWILMGIALALMLGNAGFVALARVAGPDSRRAISTMLLLTAVNPIIFFPLTAFLTETLGWRVMCLIYASSHIVIGLPLHILISRLKAHVGSGAPQALSDIDEDGVAAPKNRRSALLLVILAFSANGFIGWGMSPHLVNLLSALGAPTAFAVILASLHGPAQLAGRLVDFGFGARMSPLTVGILAGALAPIAMIAMIFTPQSYIFAFIAIALYGMSSGLSTIVRASLPLYMFGRRTYGATLGRISLPMNIACGAAPIMFASLISRVGPAATLIVGALVGLIVVFALMRLRRQTLDAFASVPEPASP